MTNPIQYDLLGIGNAIVDVLSMCEERTLTHLGLRKGGMALIDEARAEALYRQMGPATECSGGSAANTVAGLASLGGRAAFIGKVKNDQLGEIFRHDLRSLSVRFDTAAAATGPATARCLIFVTPDAQRTMNTFIGACAGVSEADIDEALIAAAAITYAEGYLWDTPSAKAAIDKALTAARRAKRATALTLSDTFCVERHRDTFIPLVRRTVDILFANEAEICALAQCNTLEDALGTVRGWCPIIAVTRSEKGCIVLSDQDRCEVAAEYVPNVIDTTGAGDLFASGFLYGISRGLTLPECARLGNRCAASIIQQMGARSQQGLATLAAA
ncbi:MAG: adenosine kinase [Alphaproteobacteria bacterium]|nr:adenosine kinase [Alphaproteobacteria bacterium]